MDLPIPPSAGVERAFGPQLRAWRLARGQSQLSLALTAGVSTRHVSYLETGRASPSREMVLTLSQAMDVPLRSRNQLLMAAGFAPLYRETPMNASAMGPVSDALQFLLGAMEPNATFVVNRRYDVIDANRTGQWILSTFTAELERFARPYNMALLLIRPQGMRPYLENWDEVARKVLGRLRRDLGGAQARGNADDALLSEVEPLLARMGVMPVTAETPPLMIGVRLRRGELALNLFTTITTLGTAQDVTLQEMRIETLFSGRCDHDGVLGYARRPRANSPLIVARTLTRDLNCRGHEGCRCRFTHSVRFTASDLEIPCWLSPPEFGGLEKAIAPAVRFSHELTLVFTSGKDPGSHSREEGG